MRGVGTRLYRSTDGSVDSYQQLAGIMGLTIPEMTRNATDITPLDVQDDTMVYEAGMSDVGEAEFSLIFNAADATQSLLDTDYASGDTLFYKVLLRDGSIILFKGFVTKLGAEIPKQESVLRKCTIKASGAVTTNATDNTVS